MSRSLELVRPTQISATRNLVQYEGPTTTSAKIWRVAKIVLLAGAVLAVMSWHFSRKEKRQARK